MSSSLACDLRDHGQNNAGFQHIYDECGIYQPFLNASKPQIQLEYVDELAETGKSIDSCDPVKDGVGMALYLTAAIDSSQITLSCPS